MNKKEKVEVSHFPLFAAKTTLLAKMRKEYLEQLETILVGEGITETLQNCEFLVTLTISKLISPPLSFIYITRRVDNLTLEVPPSFDDANFDANNKQEIIKFLTLIPFMFEIKEWDILAFENRKYTEQEYESTLHTWTTSNTS